MKEPSLSTRKEASARNDFLFLPKFSLVAKIHRDSKGEFVKLPKLGKCYLEKTE